MKKQDVHDWALSILLTLICYVFVDKFIVNLTLWNYLIIEIILIMARTFHMFAMKILFPQSYKKSDWLS